MSRDTYQALPVLHFSETIKKYHNKKRLQCLLIGNYGAYNLAGEAALTGVLTEMQRVPNCKVTVAAQMPTEVRRLHNTRAIPFSALRKEIKKSDFVIINGDGLFSTDTTFLSRTNQIYVLSLLIWKQRLFKKKMYIFSLGLSRSIALPVKQLVYSVIKSATVVTVRDQQTADLLKQKNIHVHTFKDQTYLMDPAPVSKVMQDPYFKRFYKKNRKNIGLALSRPLSKKHEKHLITELIAFMAKNQENADFWFFASDHNPKYFNDEKFGHMLHEIVKKKVGKDVQFHFIPTNWSPELFFSAIKLMDFVVSMCPYTSLFAYRHNTNLLCLTDDKMNAGLTTQLGREIIKIPDMTAKKLQSRLTQ